MTILRITAGYVLVWAAVAAVWLLIAVVRPAGDGPEFDWSAAALAFLAALVALIPGHVVWAAHTLRVLRPFGRPWRRALMVVGPPASLVLIPFGVNESVVPWQLWFVALVAVPAVAATWATARQ